MFDLVQHHKPVKFEAFIMIIIVFFYVRLSYDRYS